MREWTAAALWARRHARQRWRSLLVLGVLAGLTSSFAMAAAAGARRTDTALTRLENTTRSSDAIVFTSQVQVFHPQWRKLEHRPEVFALAPWDLLFGFVSGQPGGVLFASDDGRWGTLVDRPIVLGGRMYNPKADNEMVIDPQAAAAENLHVGDVVPFHAYSPDQPETEGQPAGPNIELKIVGIVRDTDEFLFTPGGFVSPGVVAHYRDRILLGPNAMVRIRPGHGGVGALRTDVDRLIAPNVPVLDLQSAGRRVTTTLSVENFALWVLALAIALAGGLLVAQMLSRSVSLIGEDTRPLRALGFTRADVSVGSLLAHGSVFVVTIAVALLGAIALSPLFPIGLGRQIDPDPGVHADWTVLGAGLVLTLVLLIGSTLLMTVSTLNREARHAVGRRSAVTGWLRRTAPLPVSLGVTAAFERAPVARGTPVRPALVGAIVGVLGVISALTVDHGIHHALANPQLAGVTWAVSVSPPPQDVTSSGVSRALLVRLAHAVPDGSTAVVRRDLVDVDGVGVPAFSIVDHSDRAGAISLVTVSGRTPKADDEAAIGPATAKQIDVRVGDWVRIANGARVRVVGEALFPSDVHAEFDEGLWLLPKEFDTVVPPSTPANSDEAVALRFSNDGDQESSALHAAEVVQETGSLPPTPVLDRLITELGGPNSLLYQNTEPAGVPLELVNLDDVAEIPLLLSVFLALLALAALSFVLVASGRARQQEFAVLRALGLGTSASRSIVYWQATSIALVGLAIGVPLGIVVGRWGWGEVAARVPLVYLAPTALLVIGLAIPGAVFLANFVAILPAHRVSSLRAAEVLRTE